ncbi:tRNA dihydrouridine synthase DusB [Ancylobacter dichloromethanicus]|uniref:tRNA-dihydrouridine synthase n=1 Tax=Ancylobacter dichloromethanicus TaxID=518825 RepID=A0A9W6MZ01_9HYPH|nr:tRNA dihydrouridine synthase DusB [Ancylobacter dichloromethanicus]MBS7554360.1 tRNA dihydrouridine synthase DusB [Ancylobacter dichloromethanicus]GLK71485.1 tRNA-dihydrouridine synthase [Ancylobacter dichloromethanicus]
MTLCFSAVAPLQIGTVEVPGSVVLAPMAGITDAPMRRMALRYGASLAVSEMVAAGALETGHEETLLRAEGAGVALHAVQLAGNEPALMARAARLAEAAGAALIDINMGCPAKRVTTGLAGSALLRDLDLATRIIAAVVGAVRVPVTLKTRLGWDEGAPVAPELARRAEDIGVQMITIHGRTRCQFYTGRADWAAIRAVRQAVRIPVLANGDLVDFADATAMLAASGADGVMIGRGAQGRPWFPGQVAAFLRTGRAPADPPLAEQRDVLIELYEGWLSHYGRSLGMRCARKHVGWSLAAAAASAGRAPEAAALWRKRLLTLEDPARVVSGIRDAYDDIGWREAA